MPGPVSIHAPAKGATAEHLIVRLHGPDRKAIEARTGGLWSEVVDPKDEGLKATVSIIEQSTGKEIRTFVNVNNHYEGSPPLAIQRLLEFL